jgi:pimeloyl-ACP methyl ester carboxylesterase
LAAALATAPFLVTPARAAPARCVSRPAAYNQQPAGPAHWGFAPDFPKLIDCEQGFAIGGFGGVHRHATLHHVPVIFVHGNNVDAADWYPVQDDFRAAGWTDQDMYALSYNGIGGSNGTALFVQNPRRDAEHQHEPSGLTWITSDDVNVPDLYAFIHAVQDYTGSKRFMLVTHSLGVTLARKTLKVHPALRADLVAFIGIAGANHGTSVCPPGSAGQLPSCDEISQGTQWLAALNGPNGIDETYGPARWLTVYDGSGAGDPAYAGPTYATSPALRGATNLTFPHTYHNDLRLDPKIVAVYRGFLEKASAAALATGS